MAQPRDDVFVTALGGDLVLLDVTSDTYLALRGAVVPRRIGAAPGEPVKIDLDAERALVEARLFVEGPSPAIAQWPELRTHACRSDLSLGRVTPKDLFDLIVAAAGTFARLRRRRPCASYSTLPQRTAETDAAAVTKALATLRSFRMAIPLPARCLPASLIMSIFLKRRGIDAEIVFGVRSHPFEAHCWVEHGGAVLEDDVDQLRAFTRIAAGRP